MSNVMQIVENEQTSEFYPTPESLVIKMLEGIEWDYIHTILEPSAGKGDILRTLAVKEIIYCKKGFDVDCIEIDANLRQILKYNFSEEAEEKIKRKKSELADKYGYIEQDWQTHKYKYYDRKAGKYVFLPAHEQTTFRELDNEQKGFLKNGIHIVHNNFLTYTPFKQYDLIIMNPPFSNGDRHLLKALDMQKNGGAVICLLNAETLKNPYTETRKELVNLLEQYNATIEFIPNAFVSAERRTGVEVALVKVNIERVQEESDIYNRMKEAENFNDDIPENSYDIEVTDFIKAMVNRFRVEMKAGIELIRQYRAMIPYMAVDFGDNKPILRLIDSNERGYNSVSVNQYVKAVRLKYWRLLMANPKFTGKLTSKLQQEYHERVSKLADYDFTEFNIIALSTEMNAQIKRGIEDEIIAMFDRLTEEHTWYPEMKNNRHYYDGWATNKAHKIDKKVIIPCYGIFDSWDGKPRVYEARKVLEDIERILNYLDGGMTRDIDLWRNLEICFNQGITKNVELKYFKATFYKKGTVHLVFNCPELIERFNIYVAKYKKWLPPCYGKKAYSEMADDEKKVVDSFQGEKAYNEILSKKNYYLSPVVNNQLLMITE